MFEKRPPDDDPQYKPAKKQKTGDLLSEPLYIFNLASTKQWSQLATLIKNNQITCEHLSASPAEGPNRGRNTTWFMAENKQWELIKCLAEKKLLTSEQLLASPNEGACYEKNGIKWILHHKQWDLLFLCLLTVFSGRQEEKNFIQQLADSLDIKELDKELTLQELYLILILMQKIYYQDLSIPLSREENIQLLFDRFHAVALIMLRQPPVIESLRPFLPITLSLKILSYLYPHLASKQGEDLLLAYCKTLTQEEMLKIEKQTAHDFSSQLTTFLVRYTASAASFFKTKTIRQNFENNMMHAILHTKEHNKIRFPLTRANQIKISSYFISNWGQLKKNTSVAHLEDKLIQAVSLKNNKK